MSDLISNLQRLGDAEHDDLSVAHDALAEIVRLRILTVEQHDEIERLTAERDEHARWRQKLADDLHDRESEITELRRQISEAETDARRYRDWLRGGANIPPESNRWPRWEVRCWNGRFWNTLFAEAMDAAIDEAMGLTRPDEET